MTPDDSTLLSFDHEHDTDDVVPELNEDMKLVQKANEQKQQIIRKTVYTQKMKDGTIKKIKRNLEIFIQQKEIIFNKKKKQQIF